jgi:hypothetical protein
LIVEGVLQIVFFAGASNIDNVVYGYPSRFLWTVAVLALVVTPTLVVWRTSVILSRASSGV